MGSGYVYNMNFLSWEYGVDLKEKLVGDNLRTFMSGFCYHSLMMTAND